MVLTVRLDPTLDAALERYCNEQGTTKSHVVQESLAAYLLGEDAARARGVAAVGPAFAAFERAGLIGGASLGAVRADKAAVRARATRNRAS